jgi:hypothetical protein
MNRSLQWVIFGIIALALLIVLNVLDWQDPQQKAEQVAHDRMQQVIGSSAVNRAHVEVRSSAAGWMVVFRDANASCSEGTFWPGACRTGANTFRDVYACVERDWQIRQMGASSASAPLGAGDLCQAVSAGRTLAPALTAVPSP